MAIYFRTNHIRTVDLPHQINVLSLPFCFYLKKYFCMKALYMVSNH